MERGGIIHAALSEGCRCGRRASREFLAVTIVAENFFTRGNVGSCSEPDGAKRGGAITDCHA